jgi:hypothetical protein
MSGNAAERDHLELVGQPAGPARSRLVLSARPGQPVPGLRLSRKGATCAGRAGEAGLAPGRLAPDDKACASAGACRDFIVGSRAPRDRPGGRP